MSRRVAATLTYEVEFGRRPRPAPVEPVGRVPRVTRLLALAHTIDSSIRAGELRDLAHAADVMGLTRARVTQIANLTLLAPEIQEEILSAPPITEGRDPISERQLRPIAAEPVWDRQMALWRALRPEEAE